MVNTDFILSYLTDSVNDDILDKLVTDKNVNFSIAPPEDYWKKQQIKDSYKAPDGSYNKDAFMSDYNTLSKKYQDFQIKRFGEDLLEDDSVKSFQDGGELEPALTKSKAMSRSEYENSMASVTPDYTAPSMRGMGSHKVWNGRAVKTQAGTQYVPDQYMSFTHEGGFENLAKGKTINELADQNAGVLDENGNLITQNLWEKIFDTKYITVDKTGKFQEKVAKDGQNLGLDLLKGTTQEGDVVLDKVTVGESLFGPRTQDDYKWGERSWYGKIGMGGKLIGEGLLKGGWNMVMGIPQGATSMARVMMTTNTSKAPEWLIDTNTFLESQQLRSDVATDESKWYTPQGFTSGVVSSIGQLGAIAAYTATAIKLGKTKVNGKPIMSEKFLAKFLNTTTAIGFGLWGAEGVDNELQAQGIEDANKRKAVQAGTFLLLTGVGSMTNIFLSKLEPNARKELIKQATVTALKPMAGVLAKLSDDQLVKVASKAIFDNVNKSVSKAMSQGYKLLKTPVAMDVLKEGAQEISEEIVPDATMLVFPRMYNTLMDSLGAKEEDKFRFNAYGDERYMDLLDGKTLENYFTAGLFGGIAGGIASGVQHMNDNNDKDVSYIAALTSNGNDWSKSGVDKTYNELVAQINKDYQKGLAGPTGIGLNKVSMKNEIITDANKDLVTSYADLTKTQAINDLNIAREHVKALTLKDGFLDQFKSKWDQVNKTIENVEAFNKYALSFAEKSSVNSYLMKEFASIISAQGTFGKTQERIGKIKERNDAILANDTKKAQSIQDEIMGITSKSKRDKLDVSSDETVVKKKIELYDKTLSDRNENTQQRLENLLNGVSFVKGMQQAFIKGQVNPQIDITNGRPKFSFPLNSFRRNIKGKSSTDFEAVNNFNNLNMTSESYIDLRNQEIKEEADRIKELNKPIEEEIDVLNEAVKRIIELDDIGNANWTEEEAVESNSLTSEFGINITDLDLRVSQLTSKLLPVPKAITKDTTPYLNRVDVDKFVSLDSSLDSYVKSALDKSIVQTPEGTFIPNPEFIDGNLDNILKELRVRLSQVELNYGANRKMSDFEKQAIPILGDLLKLDKTDLINSYNIGKAKIDSINYGQKDSNGDQPKLKRDGSKSFLAIDSDVDYRTVKTQLEGLIADALKLKKLSDSNTPDLNILRMTDDLEHIKGQFELFSYLLDSPSEVVRALVEIETLTDSYGKAIPGGPLNQELLNNYISLLSDQEYALHLSLQERESDNVKALKERFSKNNKELFYGYNQDQFTSFIRNIKNNNIREFFGEYGTEVENLSKVPSFTQLESIKHTYWNLKNNQEVVHTTIKNTFKNSASVWAYQGAGKTSVVAAMVSKLYSRHLASKEFLGIGGGKDVKDALFGYSYSGNFVNVKGANYKVFTKLVQGKTSGDNVYIQDSKVVKVTNETLKDESSIMLAAQNSDRIFALEEEFKKSGVKTARINYKETSLDESVSSTNNINLLIDQLNSNAKFNYNLIVIDEATLLSGEELTNLNIALENKNTSTSPKIKILFLGDLKQAGDVTGFQGEIKTFNTVIDKDGSPKYVFGDNSRESNWFSDSTKELKVRFRTGNQAINEAISYFRDGKYHDNLPFVSEYYQGKAGLKGFKVSSSEEYELQDLVQKITTNQIAKSNCLVITTSASKKLDLETRFPELRGVVLLVDEAQGKTKKYVIFSPDPVFVYGLSLTNPTTEGSHQIVNSTDASKRSDFVKNHSLTSDFYDTDSDGKRVLSTTNLDYQLAFATVSAIGRASDYACLVVPNPDKNSEIGKLAEIGNDNTKSSIKDVFSYTELKNNTVKANKKHQSKLIVSEYAKYTGDKTDTIKPDPLVDVAEDASVETPVETSTHEETGITITKENGEVFVNIEGTQVFIPNIRDILDSKLEKLSVDLPKITENGFEQQTIENPSVIERRRQEELNNSKIKIPRYFTFKELGGAKGKSGEALSSIEADRNREIQQDFESKLQEGDKLIEPNGDIYYFKNGKVVKSNGQPRGMADIGAFLTGVTIDRTDKINAKYDAEYIDKVRKGEFTAQQAKDVLKEINRLTPELSKQLDDAELASLEKNQRSKQQVDEKPVDDSIVFTKGNTSPSYIYLIGESEDGSNPEMFLVKFEDGWSLLPSDYKIIANDVTGKADFTYKGNVYTADGDLLVPNC